MPFSAHPTRALANPLDPLREILLPNIDPRRQGGTGAEAVASSRSTPASLTDDLVRDHAAFSRIVERNATFLYRIAYSLLRNGHDAEDAVQDCLLKLHRTGRWKGMEDERAFLARACWRSALDRLPRKHLQFVEATDLTLPQVETEATPERLAIAAAQSAHLHRLIDALPLNLREPLLLSGFEDLNSRQIAAILSVPEGTVRTRLKRAREELRHRWEQTTRTRTTPTRKEPRHE